jgi:hypothetical protein
VDPHSLGRPADDLDGLLRSFFQAELPDPWPVLRPPVTPAAPPARSRGRRWGSFRSRFALAASVGLLVVGQLFLSSAFHMDRPPQGGDASDPVVANRSNKIHPPKVRMDVEEKLGPDGKAVAPRINQIRMEMDASK